MRISREHCDCTKAERILDDRIFRPHACNASHAGTGKSERVYASLYNDVLFSVFVENLFFAPIAWIYFSFV